MLKGLKTSGSHISSKETEREDNISKNKANTVGNTRNSDSLYERIEQNQLIHNVAVGSEMKTFKYFHIVSLDIYKHMFVLKKLVSTFFPIYWK